MEITEVRISPSKGGKVRAFASIVIDDCFVVNDLRIVETRDGQLVVSMPTRRARNGQRRDIAHPLNTETRKRIEERVLEAFRTSLANRAVPTSSQDEERLSPLDRLARRLLSDDFWVRGDGRSGGSPREEDRSG